RALPAAAGQGRRDAEGGGRSAQRGRPETGGGQSVLPAEFLRAVSDQLVQALLLLLVFALPGVTVGARMLHRVRQFGGRVQTRALGLPDLLVSFVLCGFFGMLVVSSGLHGEAPAGRPVQVLNTDQIPSSIFFFLGCVGLLLGFLRL